MTFSCPECGYSNLKGSLSCQKCLLVFEKFEKKSLGAGQQVHVSTELKSLWDSVITDYGNKDVHEKFIQISLVQKNLAFSSQQYRKMIEINPHDDIALKMRDRIIQLATATFVPPARPTLSENKRWGFKLFMFLTFLILVILLLQVLLK